MPVEKGLYRCRVEHCDMLTSCGSDVSMLATLHSTLIWGQNQPQITIRPKTRVLHACNVANIVTSLQYVLSMSHFGLRIPPASQLGRSLKNQRIPPTQLGNIILTSELLITILCNLLFFFFFFLLGTVYHYIFSMDLKQIIGKQRNFVIHRSIRADLC